MADNFNTYINHMDFEAWRDMCVSKGALRHFAKGEEFVSIGKVGRYFGFIKSGALKYVGFSDDGTEHVLALVFGEGFVADWRFSLCNQEARVAIVAVSECEIYCLSISVIKEMIHSDPNFKDIVTQSTRAIYGTLYDRYVDMHCKTPQQRYRELLSQYPNLFSLYSLKDIASFLNITPTHLSRLRRNDVGTRPDP